MQTAVEFLQQALSLHLTHNEQMQFEGLFQQALEMEKQQIINAYDISKKEDYISGEDYFIVNDYSE